VVLYFYLTKIHARRVSIDYLKQLSVYSEGALKKPGWIDGFKHYMSFALVLLERFMFWQGKFDRFSFNLEGESVLEEFYLQKRGTILMGAHLGSFDSLRFLARKLGIKVSAVVYYENAVKFNRMLNTLNSGAEMEVIYLKSGSIDGVLSLKEKIEKGEMVAFLADRFFANSKGRTVKVPFLGKEAPFSLNPWIVAALLECPVVLVAGMRTGAGKYYCTARLLSEKLNMNRNSQDRGLRPYVEKYADFLGQLCLKYPYQWFNFFDFWSFK
jgi:predicted LPLAT superfamily acyltransferase